MAHAYFIYYFIYTKHKQIMHRESEKGDACWWRSIVVRPPVLPACFPYPALD